MKRPRHAGPLPEVPQPAAGAEIAELPLELVSARPTKQRAGRPMRPGRSALELTPTPANDHDQIAPEPDVGHVPTPSAGDRRPDALRH